MNPPPSKEQPAPPARSETRKWLTIALAAVMAWVVFLITAGPRGPGVGMTPPSLEAPGVALTADFRWKLLDLEDKPVELAKFRGRPILLNLWFTECGPCLEEMPTIANLAANPRLKDKVVFLCVSTDESTAKVREFLKDKTWGMTFLRIDSLPPPVFLTDGMPATFVIAPDGRIVTGEVGAAKWDDPPVVDFLEKLAKTAH